MKKLLVLIFCILLFASCKKEDANEASTIEQEKLLKIVDEKTEIEPIAEVKPEIGVINDIRVRLRSEPNLESKTLEYLNTGDKLTILDKSAEQQKIDSMNDYWYKVQPEDYTEGWIYGAFVNIEKDYEIIWVNTAIENEVREMLGKSDGILMKSDLDGITEFSIVSTGRIDDFVHFKNLTSLSAYYMEISDLSPLEGLTKLTSLKLSSNDISDLSSLSNLTNLTVLYLDDNEISDIKALSNLTNLTEIRLSANKISDLNALSGLTNLSNLWLMHNEISDVKALSVLTNLTDLWLFDNQISDISPLSNLTNLDYLVLEDNIDVSSLSSLINLDINSRPYDEL